MANKKLETEIELPESLKRTLLSQTIEVVNETIKSAFDKRRPFLIAELSRRLSTNYTANIATQGTNSKDWIDIESLSGLRALVGGRFQNLRDRWVACGFPLKEHRGEKNQSVDVSQEGWIELSNWIQKQGYEARLVPERKECLFQLRKIEK